MRKAMLVLAVMAMAALIAAPAFASTYIENFNYGNGALAGNDGWTGTDGGQVSVNGGAALLTYDNVYRGQHAQRTGIGVGGAGTVVHWCVDVFFSVDNTYGNAFDIQVDDAAGLNFARFYGGASWERPRIDGTGYVLGNALMTAGVWHRLCVGIDMGTGLSTFKLDNTVLGSLSFAAAQPGIGNVVDRISLGFQNAGTAQNGEQKWYDNVIITNDYDPCVPEPSSFMALGMFGLGALGFIKRRR